MPNSFQQATTIDTKNTCENDSPLRPNLQDCSVDLGIDVFQHMSLIADDQIRARVQESVVLHVARVKFT